MTAVNSPTLSRYLLTLQSNKGIPDLCRNWSPLPWGRVKRFQEWSDQKWWARLDVQRGILLGYDWCNQGKEPYGWVITTISMVSNQLLDAHPSMISMDGELCYRIITGGHIMMRLRMVTDGDWQLVTGVHLISKFMDANDWFLFHAIPYHEPSLIIKGSSFHGLSDGSLHCTALFGQASIIFY